MPIAAAIRRAGFPTVRVSLATVALVLCWMSPARAALSPTPIRLAALFEREAWSRADVVLPFPVRPGTGPIPYEVP